MNAQNNNRYPSLKFSVLSDGRSIATAKKNYFIWIITVTLLFCITLAYISYNLFIAPTFIEDQKLQSFNINNNNNNNTQILVNQPKNSKLYNPGLLLAELRKRNRKDRLESTFEESQIQIEVIPSIYIEQILQKPFQNLSDFINLDLLLYYEKIINKNEPKSLKSIFNEYHLKLLSVKESKDFVDFLMDLKSNKFKFYKKILKQQNHTLELKQFKSYFALTQELNHWYNYLYRLSSFLSTYEQQKLQKYIENCTEENFRKFTEETQKRLFYFVYPFKITEKKLHEINEIINTWAEPIKTEYINCSVKLYKKIILFSDINKEIQRLNASCLKFIYAFAIHAVYLDEDLNFLGVNLAVVAPEWLFLKKTKINLNGIPGKKFINESATHKESGKPGYPGGNAGDFLGIGNPLEKFLLISANGGKGGKGQNGAKGLDGVHNTLPDPPINKPECKFKINSYNNSLGQKLTHFKIFSPFGCGNSGTDGGVGGAGGAGGVITLISNNSINITRGSNGTSGTPGRGGAGGIGGQNGCFYEVFDIDDEVLYPVTTVKCPRGNSLPSGENGKDNYNTQGQVFSPIKENLTMDETLFQFLKFAGRNLVKNNDPNVILFIKNLNQSPLHENTSVKDLISEYKLLETFDKIEFYELFKQKIIKYLVNKKDEEQQTLNYLLSVVLGKMTVLKENVNFNFIDLKNYLNLFDINFKTTNIQVREFQSVTYLKKKVNIKIEEIKMNLNRIKLRSSALISNINFDRKSKKQSSFKNNTEYQPEWLDERKILHIMDTTIGILDLLINPTFNGSQKMRFNTALGLLQKKAFVSLQTTTSYVNDNEISTKSPLLNAEKLLKKILENLQNDYSQEIKIYISNLKDVLDSLKESDTLLDEIKHLLGALIDEMEHFIAIYNFLEWEELENLFFKSLNNLTLNLDLNSKGNEEVEFLKNQLIDVMVALQCKLAEEYSSRLWLHSLNNINTCLQLIQSKKAISHNPDYRNSLQYLETDETDSFYKNHLKAVFDKNSAIGEFYFWSNADIGNKLKNLFSGLEISLKSDLINHHVFDKNFIQFRTLKLEFESSKTGSMSQKQLDNILSNFKIEMIHSGYSYYNWKGETHILFSERVSLIYSFKVQDNNEPEVHNSLYRKCKNGEIKLSPYTIWTIRLLPMNNANDFSKLIPFADIVDLRLIGTGTYIL